MVEEKIVETEEGPGACILFIVPTLIIILIVGLGVYQYISAPFHMADKLRDRLDMLGNVTSEYHQGWLDCVDYYLWLETAPTNTTAPIHK
jgi:hypothetical protein